MLPEDRLRDVIPNLNLITIHGPWYRLVDLGELLAGPPGLPGHQWLWASRERQRFTPSNGARTLYLAGDAFTALAETETGFLDRGQHLVPRSFPPRVLFSVEGVVADVLDLTDPAVQDSLGTSPQELGGPWILAESDQLAPTQILGRAAFECGKIAGLWAASTRRSDGRSVVIFTERLTEHPPSDIDVVGVEGAHLPSM
jgi:RES domain-containing protein